MLGYGFPIADFQRGIDAGADAIVIDSGSTDNGPQELALGKRTNSRSAYRRDLEPMIEACVERKIPVLIGSAGGTGTDAQVDWMLGLVREIAIERGHKLRAAAIYADVPRDIIKTRLGQGRIGPCGPVPALTEEDVDAAENIVAQMGVEPFLQALGRIPDLTSSSRDAPTTQPHMRRCACAKASTRVSLGTWARSWSVAESAPSQREQ